MTQIQVSDSSRMATQASVPETPADSLQFVAAPEQVFSELGGEAVIMHLQSGTYFGLNEVGAFLWQQLQEPKSLIALCDALQAEYEVSLEVCKPDVEALLQQFQDAQLIEVLNEANS